MKTIFLILSLFIFSRSAATNYYFSASGSDANSGAIGAPWQTIAKFNSVFASKLPGDNFLFNRGDIFYGTMIISRSGAAGLPITIGAYGSGADPVITGLTSVSSWTNLGANIWESTAAISALPYTNLVVVNGVNTQMGRIPNTGAYHYQFHFGLTSITSNDLTGVPNWTGAELAFFATTYGVQRDRITAQSGGVVSYAAIGTDVGIQADGQAFIIQNDPRTLDVQNEWYYNPVSKKVQVYSVGSPSGVQVSTLDTLIYISGRSYITIDNISFKGANTSAIGMFSAANHITITNCDFDLMGRDAIFSRNDATGFVKVESCTINHCNNNGINFYYPASVNDTFRLNTVKNCGMITFMGNNGKTLTGGRNYSGIIALGANNLFEYNRVDSTGYIGISAYGINSTVQYNYVTNSLINLHDGGGIYTWNTDTSNFGQTGLRILNNIVGNAKQDEGIYVDDWSQGVTVQSNTVFGCYMGIYSHNNRNLNILNNTLYDNSYAQFNNYYNNYPAVKEHHKLLKNNIFFAKTATQRTAYFLRLERFDSAFVGSDSNYYARPIDDNLTIDTWYNGVYGLKNLAMLQTILASPFPEEQHSKKSPVTISNVGQLFFGYNPTDHDTTVVIPAGTWIDVRGVTYNTGSTVLHLYSSVILINTGTNIAPTANAGTSKNITLPTTSVTQVGSGTDPDGTISAYAWTQVSGPAVASFGSATSATTTINGMNSAGTYLFQLKVTDNLGLTGVDTTSVVVNSSPPVNIPPTANAGGNKVITLPTSTVTQTGSGTDPDGTVVSYSWSQNPGNPVPASIVSPASATTVINGMVVSGNYNFTMMVTDNLGATGSQNITVVVNPPVVVPPVANAGSDQVITWPANSVSLAGTGTDDGVIISYAWSKISGPASYIITNPGSQNTTVTNLAVGVYQFQLLVTDNSGATNSDIVQITVNKGNVSINVTGTSVVFNGFNQLPTVTTSPVGVTYSITLDGITGGQSQAGNYNYVVGITDPNWNFTPATGTFTITKQTVIINAAGATVNFDNNPHGISGSTTPSVTGLSATYTGISGTVYPTSATPPTAIGSYRVDFIVTNTNYQATPVSVTLNIVSNPAIIFISDTLKTYNHSPQGVTVTSAYSYTLVGSPQTGAGSYQVIATINDGVHTGADTATLLIAKRNAVLGWVPPSPIPLGAQLTTSILNATSDEAGSWTYDYPLGTQLPLGSTTVTGTFVPSDPANINGGTVSVDISVFGSNPFLNYFISGPDGKFFFVEQ